MRGHIVQRYTNSYSIVINLGKDPGTGKPRQQWITVKGSKKDTEKKLAEILHQRDTGIYIRPRKQTLGEYLPEWLKNVKGTLSPRTVEGYEQIIRRLTFLIGHVVLTQLSPSDLQRYYTDSLTSGRLKGTGGLSPLTVRHHHTLLHRALKNAMEWGLIMRNPADAAHPPHAVTPQISIMCENEVRVFLEATRNTRYFALFFTILYTGLRRSEVLALRWSDIDLLMCTLSVSRSMHRLRGGEYIFRQPKSAKGRRMIALSPLTVHVLKQYQETVATERLMLGSTLKDSDLVFSKYDGSPIRPDTLSRAWSDLAKKLGIPAHRLHDARHTHASLMLKAGIHPRVVQERLGHSTIAVTLDIYSHVLPGLQEAAAKRFDDIVHVGHNETVEQIH